MFKTIVVLVAAATFVAGCAPTSGLITAATAPAVGTKVQDFEYTSITGRQATFSQVRYPVAILAFTSPPGNACCWLDPKVVSLANQMWNLPVTVAEISLPTEKCSHGPGCSEGCRLHAGLMSLCDTSKVVWNAYGRPRLGTVILIDQDNNVVQTATLDDLNSLLAKAQQLGKVAAQSRPGGTSAAEARREIYAE